MARREILSVAAADDEYLYGSSPGTDTDGGGGGGVASAVHPQGTARVWATGFQDQDQVCHVLLLTCGQFCRFDCPLN